MDENGLLKEAESSLSGAVGKLRQEVSAIRGSRPSVELIEEIKVSCYDEMLSINQLGSLSVVPPREVQILVWDKSVVGAVAKAIDAARIGFSVTNDGNIIRATLSPLGQERRDELAKLVRKAGETARIQIRTRRDEVMKKVKAAEDASELSEDRARILKEKIQKHVTEVNDKVEAMVQRKIEELND